MEKTAVEKFGIGKDSTTIPVLEMLQPLFFDSCHPDYLNTENPIGRSYVQICKPGPYPGLGKCALICFAVVMSKFIPHAGPGGVRNLPDSFNNGLVINHGGG